MSKLYQNVYNIFLYQVTRTPPMTVQYTGHEIQLEERVNNIIIISINLENYQIQTITGAHPRFSDSCGISSFSDWLRIC